MDKVIERITWDVSVAVMERLIERRWESNSNSSNVYADDGNGEGNGVGEGDAENDGEGDGSVDGDGEKYPVSIDVGFSVLIYVDSSVLIDDGSSRYEGDNDRESDGGRINGRLMKEDMNDGKSINGQRMVDGWWMGE